ncbi:hypothetical protein HHK36_017088 [Tetracentron sinense]|uniref:Isocitrate lyase n=1 Tax=Tetracentron sinense TaxID=13715 RepID=A0A835DEV2_TETSI|nr:hypothetical protein HHK36_017088 [Tetracentron sinense]
MRWGLKTTLARSGERKSQGDSPSKALRWILESSGIHQGPACYDALGAKLVENAGFEFCFTSGFSVSAARLGLPDVGLISYGEMVDQGHQITQAVSIPVIGDEVSAKACGHTLGRKVVSREEVVMRIKVAIDARKESGSDIIIVARTNSRQAMSFDESLWRSRAFADAGADVLFIDALASKEEMNAFCEICPLLPKMVHHFFYNLLSHIETVVWPGARSQFQQLLVGTIEVSDTLWNIVYGILANMLEGWGKTPILNPNELGEIGFKIVSYPLSLIRVSIRAMQVNIFSLFFLILVYACLI